MIVLNAISLFLSRWLVFKFYLDYSLRWMHYLEENYVQCALRDRKLGVLITRLFARSFPTYLSHYFDGFSFNKRLIKKCHFLSRWNYSSTAVHYDSIAVHYVIIRGLSYVIIQPRGTRKDTGSIPTGPTSGGMQENNCPRMQLSGQKWPLSLRAVEANYAKLLSG